jgi:hypothetical protein
MTTGGVMETGEGERYEAPAVIATYTVEELHNDGASLIGYPS